jgi:hypothetical protein
MLDFNIQLWDQLLDDETKAIYAQAGYYTSKLKLGDGTIYDNVNIIALNT